MAKGCLCLGFPLFHYLLEFAQTHLRSSEMPCNSHIFYYTLQSFPASGSFLMSQLFTSGGQIIVASAKSSPTAQLKSINSLVLSLLYGSTLTSIHDYWKSYSFDHGLLSEKVMSLLCHMLSRFAIAFLPRSKRLLISWLQSPSAGIWSPPK